MSKENPFSVEGQTDSGETRPFLDRLKANFESVLKKGAIGLLTAGIGLGVLSAALAPLAPVPFIELANLATGLTLGAVIFGATYIIVKGL